MSSRSTRSPGNRPSSRSTTKAGRSSAPLTSVTGQLTVSLSVGWVGGSVEILQLNGHLIHTAGSQLDAVKRQSVPVIVVEDAAALPHAGQHMVIGAQQKRDTG